MASLFGLARKVARSTFKGSTGTGLSAPSEARAEKAAQPEQEQEQPSLSAAVPAVSAEPAREEQVPAAPARRAKGKGKAKETRKKVKKRKRAEPTPMTDAEEAPTAPSVPAPALNELPLPAPVEDAAALARSSPSVSPGLDAPAPPPSLAPVPPSRRRRPPKLPDYPSIPPLTDTLWVEDDQEDVKGQCCIQALAQAEVNAVDDTYGGIPEYAWLADAAHEILSAFVERAKKRLMTEEVKSLRRDLPTEYAPRRENEENRTKERRLAAMHVRLEQENHLWEEEQVKWEARLQAAEAAKRQRESGRQALEQEAEAALSEEDRKLLTGVERCTAGALSKAIRGFDFLVLKTQDTLSALRRMRQQMESDGKRLGDAAESISADALAPYKAQSAAGPGTPRSLLRVLQQGEVEHPDT